MSDVVADSDVQALILSSTRKIASQPEKVSLVIGNYYINLQAHACVESKSMSDYIRKLEYGVHVDESDEMLSRGFKDQIYDVCRYLPPDLQVVLISITLPNEILKFKSKFVPDHIGMHVKRDELTFEGIKQFCAPIENGEWKSDTMCHVHDLFTITEAVIFCNTNQKTCSFWERKLQTVARWDLSVLVAFLRAGFDLN